jgi:hypothetical protein
MMVDFCAILAKERAVPDVTEFLPKESPVVTAIYAWHKERGDAEPFRGYCGASEIGHPCERYLWYKFRGCCKEELSGRKYRLFQTGHYAEPRFVTELRGIGCEIHEVNEDGSQFAIYEHGGHFSGHMDGAIRGVPGAEKTWHVWEAKTHNNKSFVKLVKEGVQKSKPQHYAQMQAYMHKTGMKRALYLAVNKDTDELHAERIHYDKAYAEGLMAKALRIITSNTPPARLSERPDWYECGWCSARDLCHGTAESSLPLASVNCRQCCHATPIMDGNAAWKCARHARGLCGSDQDKACCDHLILPGLLYGCEPADYGTHDVGGIGNQWIEFTKEDGELFRHGRQPGEYSTDEMRALPLSSLTSGLITKTKELFNATVTEYSPDDILSRYPAKSVVWTGAAYDLASEWKQRYGEDVDLRKALGTVKDTDYAAAEMPGGRVITHKLPGSNQCEIRENK